MQRTSATTFLALCACAIAVGCAHDTPATPTGLSLSTGNPLNTGSKEPYTLAVIGDTPYGAAKVAEFPSLSALINSDPKVDLVVHLGDIKTGMNLHRRVLRDREVVIRRLQRSARLHPR